MNIYSFFVKLTEIYSIFFLYIKKGISYILNKRNKYILYIIIILYKFYLKKIHYLNSSIGELKASNS